MTLDFCVATSKNSVRESVHCLGPEKEPKISENTEEAILESPYETKGDDKETRVNADPHLGSRHKASGTFEDPHILSPVSVRTVGRRVYRSEESILSKCTTCLVHKSALKRRTHILTEKRQRKKVTPWHVVSPVPGPVA